MSEESTGTFTASADEDLRVRLVEEFAAFGPAYIRWVKSRLQEGSISYARMRLLSALRCKGPQIMSSLSEELGVTTPQRDGARGCPGRRGVGWA